MHHRSLLRRVVGAGILACVVFVGLGAAPAGAQQTGPAKSPIRAKRPGKGVAEAFPDFDYRPNIEYKKVGDQSLQLDMLTPKGLSKIPAPLFTGAAGEGATATG